MRARLMSPIIAVDGGGSRCRLVLDQDGSRQSVETGPANVATDFDAAIGEIKRGIAALSDSAGMPVDDLTRLPAYLALAGAADRDLRARVEGALPFQQVRVEEDRAAAFQGALGSADGSIAHCGTGSFFGIRRDGAVHFVGGWGAKLGDSASAHWVGREALAGTLDVVDGLQPASPLSEALRARWNTPADLVAFASTATPDAIGDIARDVAAAAKAGDALGRAVMQAGADHVSEMLDRIGWQPGLAICFTGGLAPNYEAYLPDPKREALVAAQAAPIDGAVALARAFAMEARR